MKNSRAVTIAALSLSTALLFGCSSHDQNTSSTTSGSDVPAPVSTPGPTVTPPPAAITDQSQGIIYTVSTSPNADDNGLAPKAVEFTDSKNPARSALDALIDSTNTPLASGTHLIGVKIADGLATVDFSPEFKSNFHGSDSQEAQAINSILGTLGQFASIERVQILVDGKAIDSLGEHFEISGPLDVIRPPQLRQAKSSGTETHG